MVVLNLLAVGEIDVLALVGSPVLFDVARLSVIGASLINEVTVPEVVEDRVLIDVTGSVAELVLVRVARVSGVIVGNGLVVVGAVIKEAVVVVGAVHAVQSGLVVGVSKFLVVEVRILVRVSGLKLVNS